ncbi:MAG: TfoX/Sxy family protein [Actinobacteria bacterium]|nr:TfoX/Sxy family protein [Actinomycetota bacterium]MCI0679443.1 TfoX/Sxy family protein [Actinomycetota bacterium]
MAYDEALADDIRARIGTRPDVTEREMFGGIAFMIGGHMAVGVSGEELMVRVGKEAHDEAVARRGARIFDLSARPIRGWIVVSAEGFPTEADLDAWVSQGVAYAESLPPKT